MHFHKKIKVISVFFGVMALLSGCTGKGPTLAKVGSHRITESDLALVATVNPRLKPRMETPAGKQKVLENYVEQELFYQESVGRGVDRSSLVKDKLKLYEKIIIAQALLDDELDKRVKEYYDNHRDEFERVKVSDIFVKSAAGPETAKPGQPKGKKSSRVKSHSEAEALALLKGVQGRLAKGEDFGKVARETSEDERTKNILGDLGYITIRDKRLERWGWLPLAEKAFAMKAGEVSNPIKVQDGYVIVKVVEEKKLQPLEEADPGVRFRIQGDVRSDLLENLKKKYKVEYVKSETPSPAPATVPTPGTIPSTPPFETQSKP